MKSKLFVLYISILLILFSCTSKTSSIVPEIRRITESVYASGHIKSIKQYEVYGIPNATIKEIYVSEGMRIKKDAPMFQLDNKNLKLATENARLSSTASDYRVNTDQLVAAQKNIALAQKKFINDSLLYHRQKKLWAQNIGSKVDLEQRALNFENSRVALATAKTNYDVLKRQLKLLSDQSKNNLKIAEILEDDYVIKSELDGVIYQINKEKGELINGLEAVAIIGTDEFEIELNVDELDIVKIKEGQPVFIRMDSYQSQVFEAKVVDINPMMNTRTRSFQVEALFLNPPPELFPNLTVEANILIHAKEEALTIPRKYLIEDSLVLLEDGTYKKVETGLMDYDIVEIISGIDSDTRIVLPE